MTDVGILIITYNSAEEIGGCLDKAKAANAEILVIDNASSDDTAEEVRARGVRLVRNATNRGFAAAVNQGFRMLDKRLVLLLNPDAYLESSIDQMREECSRDGVAAAGGRILSRDGELQKGWAVRRLPTAKALCFEVLGINRLWPRNAVNWRLRCYDLDLAKMDPQTVEQPAGAFLMIRRDAWERLGEFDEGFYPLWFEEVDFCRRAKDAGLRIIYVPSAVVRHTGAHSIRKLALGDREIYWYGSLLRYAAKHFNPLGRRLVCSAVVAGSAVRAAGRLMRRSGWKDIAIYWKIVGVAAECFLSREQYLGSSC